MKANVFFFLYFIGTVATKSTYFALTPNTSMAIELATNPGKRKCNDYLEMRISRCFNIHPKTSQNDSKSITSRDMIGLGGARENIFFESYKLIEISV